MNAASEPPPVAGAVAATPGLTAASWEQRYRDGSTPWDLGGPPPALLESLARPPLVGAALRVLVPGAGLGHDALALARAGHRVTAVDVAPSPCAALRARAQRAGLALEVLEADVLALPSALRGAFQLVWEQTCLCALPTHQHAAYVDAMAQALELGGLYLGLFWNHGQPAGPPLDISPALVRELFARRFTELSLQPVALSAAARREFLFRAIRRA